jgi:hypothetical protein
MLLHPSLDSYIIYMFWNLVLHFLCSGPLDCLVIHVVSATGLPKKVCFFFLLFQIVPWIFRWFVPQDALSGLSDPFIVFMVQQVQSDIQSTYMQPHLTVWFVVFMILQRTTPSEPWKVRDRTPVQKKTINPTWNHCMIFPIALDSSQSVVAPDKVHAVMCCSASA